MSDGSLTATVNIPVTVPDLSPTLVAKLAREVVVKVRDLPEILAMFRLDQNQYDRIIATPYYKRVFEQFSIEWESALNTQQRLAIQSAAYMEEAGPVLAARMVDRSEPLNGVVETAKMFTKLAGIGEQKIAGANGEKFTITINLGADKSLKFEKELAPKVIEHDAKDSSV